MKTVPVKLGQGGPVIGTCTIDDKNKTMHVEYDKLFLNSYKDSWWRNGKPPSLSSSIMYEIDEKISRMEIIDMVMSPGCETCAFKALKEIDVESIEIKL